MTATSGKTFPVGLRYGSAFALNAAGIPAATTHTAPYEGLQFYGANAFNLTPAAPRKIDHPGDDRLLASDYLPPVESATATIEVSRYDLTLNALLTNTKTFSEGDITAMPWMTNQQGNEPSVLLFLYQQALNGSTRLRNWRGYIVPSARCIPQPAGMTANQTNVTYNVTINPVTSHPWGIALTANTEGATEAGVIEFHSEYQPWLAAWKGNNSATEFSFSANHLAYSTSKIKVWQWAIGSGTSTDVTGTVTLATDKITFGTAPASGDIVIALYEQA